MLAVPACDGDAGPTAEEFVDSVGASQRVLHYSVQTSMTVAARIEVSVRADGRYVIQFSDGSVPGADRAALEAYLRAVRLEGDLGDDVMMPFLEALARTDLEDFAQEMSGAECPEVTDAGHLAYTLTNQSASRQISPCDAWSIADYPAMLSEAHAIAEAAIDHHAPLGWPFLGEGLDGFGYDIRGGGSLVRGELITIDRADHLALTIRVSDVLIGGGEFGDLRHAVDTSRIYPSERAIVDGLEIGDRALAVLDADGDVSMVGFLDDTGGVINTGVATSSLSLGWAAHLAAQLETYTNLGVECPASAFFREDPADALGPLDALIEHGERIAAEEARRLAQKRHRRRAEGPLFTATLARVPDSGYLVITGPGGRFLGQIPLDGRRQRVRAIDVPPEGKPAVVWLLAEADRGACDPFEYGALALSVGERMFEIPYDELTVGDIAIDIEGRTYRIES
jgi:hypothetical protein